MLCLVLAITACGEDDLSVITPSQQCTGERVQWNTNSGTCEPVDMVRLDPEPPMLPEMPCVGDMVRWNVQLEVCEPVESAPVTPVLDPECRPEVDFVVRTAAVSPEGSVFLRIFERSPEESFEVFSFTVHICHPLEEQGFFSEISTFRAFPDEENIVADDPTGIIIPGWVNRFYDFKAWEDDLVRYTNPEFREFSRSDYSGSMQFLDWDPMTQQPIYTQHREPGDVIHFRVTASVRRTDWVQGTFVVGIGSTQGAYAAKATVGGRNQAWGVYVTYPSMVNLE